MIEVKRGDNIETPWELRIEGNLVVRSADRQLVDWLSENAAFLDQCHRSIERDRQATQTRYVETKLWRDLPDEAKNILEWMEDVHTGKKNTITIEVGQRPSFSTSRVVPKIGNKPIVVDSDLYKTIRFYIEHSNEDREYPYIFNESSEGRLAIWNEMPENTMTVGWGLR